MGTLNKNNKIVISKTLTKILVSYLTIILISISLISILLYNNFSKATIEDIQTNIKENLVQNMNQMEIIRNQVYALGLQLMSDSDIVYAMYQDESEELTKYKATNKLIQARDSNPMIHSIYVYNSKFDIYLSFFSEIAGSIARKQAIPINDLLDQYGKALKEKIPQGLWDTLTVDGKIYGVPSVYAMTELERGFFVRKDLRLKYNLPEITDVASMEKFFETIAANEKDLIPCGSAGLRGTEFEKDSVGHSIYLLEPGLNRFMYINQDVQPLEVENYYKTDLFKKSWELNIKAYQNGWIPKDALSDNDWGGLFIAGKAASTGGDLYMLNDYTNQLQKNVPAGEVEMAIFNKEGEWQDVNPVNNFGMISSTSKNPDRAVMFLNWLHESQENYDAYMLGIKGVTYTLEGDKAAVPAGMDPKDKFAPTPWFTMYLPFARTWTTDSQAYIDAIKFWSELKPKATPLQTFQYSSENVKAEVAAVDKVVTDMGKPLQMGILSTQADYDKFIAALEKAGIQKIIDDTQRQVDEFMAKK